MPVQGATIHYQKKLASAAMSPFTNVWPVYIISLYSGRRISMTSVLDGDTLVPEVQFCAADNLPFAVEVKHQHRQHIYVKNIIRMLYRSLDKGSMILRVHNGLILRRTEINTLIYPASVPVLPDFLKSLISALEGALTVMLLSIFRISCIVIAIGFFWGCAGSAAKPKFAETMEISKYLDGNDIAMVNMQAAAGVEMLGVDLQRLKEIIQLELATKLALNASAGETDSYDVNVLITQYEKGSAFARAMLIGLGQIHIDATVTVVSAGTHDTMSEFTVNKTFAWGGLYGGVTGIQDVEPAFAEGVAAGVTGQTSSSEKQKKKK